MQWWFGALLVSSLLLAGCSGQRASDGQAQDEDRTSRASGASTPIDRSPEEPVDPWTWGEGETRRTIIREVPPSSDGKIAVATGCATAAEPAEFARVDDSTAHVLEGTDVLHIAIESPGVHTGFQVGWSIDDGAIEWLPIMEGADASFEVSVTSSQTETKDQPDRWNFFYRIKSPVLPVDCSNGIWAGPGWTVVVSAQRASD